MSEPILLDKGAIDILLSLSNGDKSFNELKTLGFSPNTILIRLRQLEHSELVKQELRSRNGRKARIIYVLTAKGQEVLDNYRPVLPQYIKAALEVKELEHKVRSKTENLKNLLLSVRAAPSRKAKPKRPRS